MAAFLFIIHFVYNLWLNGAVKVAYALRVYDFSLAVVPRIKFFDTSTEDVYHLFIF